MSEPTFRFAPSPNGPLHLGHGRSAFLNHDLARAVGGRFLLRIEDIDVTRCRPEFEAAIRRDLDRLGLHPDGEVRRQSEHFDVYAAALDRLQAMGLVYPAFLTRAEIRARVAAAEATGRVWPRDPDAAPLYPTEERQLPAADARARLLAGTPFTWRLDMDKAMAMLWERLDGAPLGWQETGPDHRDDLAADVAAVAARAAGTLQARTIRAAPADWGDVVLARKEIPTSYHLSVVVDDALQGVTDVVRGRDLYAATSVHRLLQVLLDLPQPRYHHHALVTDAEGRKLSKSEGDTGLSALIDRGMSPAEIRRLCGL
ncbi:MAG: tRNA glutamyl-Q(34) synthetase GluQRS [Ancalomicrobiaceae bacterium]|nr:tRNA glutamyl-Q(34) synthetase GluQRS [Ancalomicrobiaceae bacterium]